MTTLSTLISAAAQLSTEQQRELNRALCALIKQGNKINAIVQGSKFMPGQVVRFNAKTRGIKMIKIEKFNRAGTAVVGRECDAKGVQTSTMRWTVGATLCTIVE